MLRRLILAPVLLSGPGRLIGLLAPVLLFGLLLLGLLWRRLLWRGLAPALLSLLRRCRLAPTLLLRIPPLVLAAGRLTRVGHLIPPSWMSV